MILSEARILTALVAIECIKFCIAHQDAWEKAEVLHRDVSVGNILIVDDPSTSPFTGFLHDFDYSSMTAEPPKPGEGAGVICAMKDPRRERTVRPPLCIL